MSDSIRLHPEHGLNPAIPRCYFCGEDKNELILPGAACKGEAPRNAVWDMSPCQTCKAQMDVGIMLIGVKDGEYEKMEEHREV